MHEEEERSSKQQQQRTIKLGPSTNRLPTTTTACISKLARSSMHGCAGLDTPVDTVAAVQAHCRRIALQAAALERGGETLHAHKAVFAEFLRVGLGGRHHCHTCCCALCLHTETNRIQQGAFCLSVCRSTLVGSLWVLESCFAAAVVLETMVCKQCQNSRHQERWCQPVRFQWQLVNALCYEIVVLGHAHLLQTLSDDHQGVSIHIL